MDLQEFFRIMARKQLISYILQMAMAIFDLRGIL